MEANISLVLEHILNEVTALRQETSELRAQIEQQDLAATDLNTTPTTNSGSKQRTSKNNNSAAHSTSYYNQNNDNLIYDDNNMDPLDSQSSDMVKFECADGSFNIGQVSGQVLPLEPFHSMEEFLQFAQEMEDNPARVQLLVG